RRAFWARGGLGIALLIIAYILLTAVSDFRDNFAVELGEALGYGDDPAIFSLSELPIAALILPLFGLTALIRDNRRAVLVYHVMIIAGA
ncbi:DUF5690 family protein, partial [Salmonella enterica subsp. enterica serovar Typhimurium]|nr:DUF5690 family protein [Salmonella enterica subsp. enterica serovar Typhimurium]